MKRLICEIDDVLHRKFKTMCASKGLTMKNKLKELVELYIKYSENEMDTTDLIKALVQKERKQELNDAQKEYKSKKESKKEIRKSDKIAQKKKILLNTYGLLYNKYNTGAGNGYFKNINEDIKQCEDLIEGIEDFNEECPSNALKLEKPEDLLERFIHSKKKSD